MARRESAGDEGLDMREHERAELSRTALRLARVAAATLFGATALMKLFGFASFVNLFQGGDLYSPPMRYVVGSVELAGAVLVLRERSAFAGAALLLCITIFAILHVASVGRSPLPLSVLVVLTAGVMVVERRHRRRPATPARSAPRRPSGTGR